MPVNKGFSAYSVISKQQILPESPVFIFIERENMIFLERVELTG